jgi:hypothetical protein
LGGRGLAGRTEHGPILNTKKDCVVPENFENLTLHAGTTFVYNYRLRWLGVERMGRGILNAAGACGATSPANKLLRFSVAKIAKILRNNMFLGC